MKLGRVVYHDTVAVPGSPAGLLKAAAAYLALDTPSGPFYFACGRVSRRLFSKYLF